MSEEVINPTEEVVVTEPVEVAQDEEMPTHASADEGNVQYPVDEAVDVE